MKLILTRIDYGAKGTYGFLSIEGEPPRFVTLELPWKDNQRQVSCIPKGTYQLKRKYSPRFQRVWEVKDVPGRSDILIHRGNFIHEIQGCILLGRGILPIDPKNDVRGISNSKLAIADFMDMTKHLTELTLEIR